MKDYDSRELPKLDDDSEEAFNMITNFIDELYEKAKKEREEKSKE